MDGRLESAGAWRQAVESKAHDLESALFKLVNDYGVCLMCEAEYKNSIASHIAGQKHFKWVGHKTGWKWPTNVATYVQTWNCNDGSCYFMNHITLEHGPSAAAAAAPSATGATRAQASSPAVAPPAPPPPPPRSPAAAAAPIPLPDFAPEARPPAARREASSPTATTAPRTVVAAPSTIAPTSLPQPAPANASQQGAQPAGPAEDTALGAQDGWSQVGGKKSKKKGGGQASTAAAPAAAASPTARAAAAGPASDGRRLECLGCHKNLPRENFSSSQLKGGRKCKACVDAVANVEQKPPLCVVCGLQREWGDFNKRINWDSPTCRPCLEEKAALDYTAVCLSCHRRLDKPFFRKQVNWDKPECRECLEAKEAEQAFAVCTACERKLHRREYRKNVANWDAPTCRSCLEEQESREYEQRLRQYEEEIRRRQQDREEAGEAEMKAYIEDNIVGPARDLFGALPQSLGEVRFCGAETNPFLMSKAGRQRFEWAERLANLINDAMDSGSLPETWCHETPSREHATDKEVACAFKELEDLGDRLVQDEAVELFERFVLGREIHECSREELMDATKFADDSRSCFWVGRGVVVSIRPKQGWKDIGCVKQDLRAEPRSQKSAEPGSKKYHPEGDQDFAQFTPDTRDAMARILRPGSLVEVKTYRSEFWTNLEEVLYEDRDEAGSHNQIFDRAYGLAGGVGAGANRTEIMNAVADMLGFHDGDKGRPDTSWKSIHADLLPPRLRVHYGFGREFNADKLWKSKMEANMAEALIGGLFKAGMEDLARAVVGLCFLTYVSSPLGLLPSNWAMAEKVLMLAKEDHGEDIIVVKHLQAESFGSWMEQCITG